MGTKFLSLLCCAVLGCSGRVQLFTIPWTVTHQAPLSMGILQARILEWVATPSSRGSSQPKDWTQLSLMAGGFFTSWATRESQEYLSGRPIPSPVDLSNPGIEPGSLALPADSLAAELPGKHPSASYRPPNLQTCLHFPYLLNGEAVLLLRWFSSLLCWIDGSQIWSLGWEQHQQHLGAYYVPHSRSTEAETLGVGPRNLF